jgi:hypothetical protein
MTVNYYSMTVNYLGVLTLEIIGFFLPQKFTMVNYRRIFITLAPGGSSPRTTVEPT